MHTFSALNLLRYFWEHFGPNKIYFGTKGPHGIFLWAFLNIQHVQLQIVRLLYFTPVNLQQETQVSIASLLLQRCKLQIQFSVCVIIQCSSTRIGIFGQVENRQYFGLVVSVFGGF